MLTENITKFRFFEGLVKLMFDNKKIIILFTLITMISSYFFTMRLAKNLYEYESEVIFNPIHLNSVFDGVEVENYQDLNALPYILVKNISYPRISFDELKKIISSDEFIANLNKEASVAANDTRISIVSDEKNKVIKLSVKSTDPEEITSIRNSFALLANKYANMYIENEIKATKENFLRKIDEENKFEPKTKSELRDFEIGLKRDTIKAYLLLKKEMDVISKSGWEEKISVDIDNDKPIIKIGPPLKRNVALGFIFGSIISVIFSYYLSTRKED